MERDGGEVELDVVSVHGKFHMVLLDNVTQWQHVDEKLERPRIDPWGTPNSGALERKRKLDRRSKIAFSECVVTMD